MQLPPPGRVGQRLAGRDLDPLGQPPGQLHLQGHRDRGPAGQRPQRGGQAAVGQDRRVDAAR
ncbi:MAG TPA: hypothetical protein VF070_38400, partial [Streptosporangiaceae bacterium]